MGRGERFREARKHWQSQGPDRTTVKLCGILGISEPTYYNWEQDKTKGLLAENLIKFCQLTRFSPSWILLGRGPKMLADDQSLSELLEVVADFSEDEYKALVQHATLLRDARQPPKS